MDDDILPKLKYVMDEQI